MIPRLGHVHLPRLTGLCRWLGMFCGLAITSCTASNQPVVVVTVNGITSALVTESVKTTLGGKPSTNQLDVLRRGLEKFELRLAEDAQGTLGIAVSAQGSDGCTARAGSTSVDVSGPGSYEATIDLADSPGCLLVVRKEGDGAARVKLSDGTQWSFAPPDPPAAACPLELLAGSAQSKAFTVGSSVTVLAETSLDFAPNSYIADISGCTSGAGGCSLTIEPDPVQVTLRVGRNTACSNDQVCWEHPKPQGLHLRRIKGSNDNDIWASGDGTLLHWEGTYWSTPRRARVPNQYLGIVSSEVGSAVFVGSTGVVSRLESSIWSCLETKGTQDLRAAWGPTPNDFWAVGAKGTLVHWDGKAWSTSTIAGSTELWGIAGTGANNIWAVGDASTVLHYDGASWNKVPLGASMATTLSLRGVWVDPSGEVWIVGDSGISLSIRNGQTTAWATGTTATINDIFAIPGQHKWAVGDGGTLLRHDGQSWSAVESGTRETLNSLWGGSATSIWAVGNYGTQLRYNGVFWTVASSARKTQNLYALGTIPTASGQTGTLFGVGDQGTVMRNSGADWLLDAAINGMTTRTLRAASSTSTSIWLAGDAGTILNWNFAGPRSAVTHRHRERTGPRCARPGPATTATL